MKINSRQLYARCRKLQDKRGSLKKIPDDWLPKENLLCTIASLQVADDDIPVSLVQNLIDSQC